MSVCSSYAQNIENSDTSKKVLWGINVDVGASELIGGVLSLNHRPSLTYGAGIGSRIPLSDRLTLSASLGIRQNSYSVHLDYSDSRGYRYRSRRMYNFLHLPITIDYVLSQKEKYSTFIGGGVMVQHLLNSSISYSYLHDSGERDQFYLIQDYDLYEPYNDRNLLSGVIYYGREYSLPNNHHLIIKAVYTYDIKGRINWFHYRGGDGRFHTLMLRVGYYKNF